MSTVLGRRPGATAGAVIVAICLSAIGTGAATPEPGPSEPPLASPAPAGSTGPTADVPHAPFTSDPFAEPPDPLSLSPTLATRRASSKVIGPKGGTLKARGADGTRYTLDVPAESVPMGMTITMTPLDAVGGFPEGAQPENVLGVQLEPDGLPLAAPATLTIAPKGKLPVELAALDYSGSGAEAGFHVFEADSRRITIPVEHFSGLFVTFPMRADQIRTVARYNRTDPASVLASEIAGHLALDRKRQMITDEGQTDLTGLARHYLPLFVEVVLTPRLAAAARGCAQAEAAIAAILAYETNRQLLGVGDDPAFALPAGTSELMRLPSRLIDLRVRLCFREAHARCVRTGDFPGMAAYFFASFRQAEIRMGTPPTAEQIELAHGYLRRCGRYRSVVLLDSPDQDGNDFERKERFRVVTELEWRPGDGSYGIVGSTIEGEGEHEDIDFAFADAGCDRRRGSNVSNPATKTPGRAKIESLTYDLVYGPTLTGEPLPPMPRSLELWVSVGTVGYDYRCSRSRETQEYESLLFVFDRLDVPATRALGSAAMDIKEEWTFSVNPFKATWTFHKAFPPREGGTILDLDVSLTHEPT